MDEVEAKVERQMLLPCLESEGDCSEMPIR
jgi:hypothetical protein